MNRRTGDRLTKERLDEAQSYGSRVSASNAQKGFEATRKGDTITITGMVTLEWEDAYDFNSGADAGLCTDAARTGFASKFGNPAAWQQELTANFRIVDGDLKLVDYKWQDLNN